MSNNPYLEIYKQSRGARFNGAFEKIQEALGVNLDPADVGVLARPELPPEHISTILKKLGSFKTREDYCSLYSFAVPNDEAIKTICKYSPIVEIGAGAGYWASLIAEAGGIITAYDSKEWENIQFGKYFPVRKGSYEKLKRKTPENRTLFLCWSPYAEPLAYNCVKNFKGKHVIYIGEGNGGCTGDDAFHDYMDNHFKVVDGVEIPQWEFIHDRLIVFERK